MQISYESSIFLHVKKGENTGVLMILKDLFHFAMEISLENEFIEAGHKWYLSYFNA